MRWSDWPPGRLAASPRTASRSTPRRHRVPQRRGYGASADSPRPERVRNQALDELRAPTPGPMHASSNEYVLPGFVYRGNSHARHLGSPRRVRCFDSPEQLILLPGRALGDQHSKTRACMALGTGVRRSMGLGKRSFLDTRNGRRPQAHTDQTPRMEGIWSVLTGALQGQQHEFSARLSLSNANGFAF